MKKMYVLVLAVIAASVIAGCKKDDTAIVVGFWTGTYDGSNPFAMLFRSDGTVRVFANETDTSMADAAEGTYTVSDSVRTYYDYGADDYSTAAKMNDAGTSMVGTYGEGTVTDDGGVFALTK